MYPLLNRVTIHYWIKKWFGAVLTDTNGCVERCEKYMKKNIWRREALINNKNKPTQIKGKPYNLIYSYDQENYYKIIKGVLRKLRH